MHRLNTDRERRHHHHQSGAALIITLVFLVVVTLIGVSAMRTTTMEENMAGNLRNQAVAFEGAEAALREGEGRLLGFTSQPATPKDCPDGASECTERVTWQDSAASWESLAVDGVGDARVHVRFSRFRQFSVQGGRQDDYKGVHLFHVTGCSTGTVSSGACDGEATTILQTTYRRRFQ